MPSPEIESPLGGISPQASLAVCPEFALFPSLKQAESERIFLHQRQAMVVISHDIEQNIAQLSLPALLFAGFQHLSRFLKQVDLYHELALQGHQIFIFAVPNVAPPPISGIEYIFLSEKHALAREWFVIANSADYFSALVAEEVLQFPLVYDGFFPGKSLFQGIWTFDDKTVTDLVKKLLAELGLQPQTGILPSYYDYHKQLSAVTSSANHLITQLENRNHDLLQQQSLYEDLVNMLVHDLRGSLTSVIGSLEILYTNRVENEAERDLLIRNSLENSRRLAHMISNLLDFNKMEAGQFQIQRVLINMADLIYSVAARWNVTAIWQHKTLVTKVEPNLPVLIGDPDLIERVLDNLLGNAVKHAELIQLRARFRDKFLEVDVEDNGPGISPEDRARIFDKYIQAKPSEDQRSGSGLGLAFSKMAVEAHGGQIDIRDAHQGGIIFTILLPLIPPRIHNEHQIES